MPHYVYSTLTADNTYHLFAEAPEGGVRRVKKSVTIKGGANLAHTKTLITAEGAVTCVTDEDMKILENDPTFKLHIKGGFIKVDSKKMEVEKAVKNLEAKDGSAPLTPEDFLKKDKKAPIIGAPK